MRVCKKITVKAGQEDLLTRLCENNFAKVIATENSGCVVLSLTPLGRDLFSYTWHTFMNENGRNLLDQMNLRKTIYKA